MKIAIILTGLLAGLFLSGSCTAQEPKNVKKELTKEISVTDENGEKKVTITTTENGKISTETYVGKEAEAKIREMESGESVSIQIEEDGEKADVSVSVDMQEKNGVKTLTVVTIEDGETSTKTYTGAEAEAKLKEFENNPPKGEKGKKVKQSVQVRKIETNEK